MRKAFNDTLFQLAADNPRVALLTGDLGFQVFDPFHKQYGRRFVNVGVAEAALVSAAAGMAQEGWRPFAYSIASFITGRAFEQIRITVDYPKLPVVITGGGGGYTYASSGVTHHAAEDIALMSVLPNMTVVIPGDPYEIRELMPQMVALDGPSYLRVGRYGEPTYAGDEQIVLGKGRKLRDGERVAVLTTGDMALVVHEALDTLAGERVFPIAYQFHTVKPLDWDLLNRLATEVDWFVVVEECFPGGGLASAISSWAAARESAPRVLRLGPPDRLALNNHVRDALRANLGYDATGIAEACRQVWNKRSRPETATAS
jgi:transketolase